MPWVRSDDRSKFVGCIPRLLRTANSPSHPMYYWASLSPNLWRSYPVDLHQRSFLEHHKRTPPKHYERRLFPSLAYLQQSFCTVRKQKTHRIQYLKITKITKTSWKFYESSYTSFSTAASSSRCASPPARVSIGRSIRRNGTFFFALPSSALSSPWKSKYSSNCRKKTSSYM